MKLNSGQVSKRINVRNLSKFWKSKIKSTRDNYHKNLSNCFSFSISDKKKSFNIGLESTIRLINKGTASFLIMANEFSPRFCAKHLISSTLHKNPKTKVIIVERLKEITKDLFNVPAIIFSITNSFESVEFNAFYDHLSVHSEWLENYCRIQKKIDVSNESKRRKKKTKPEENSPTVTIIKKSDMPSSSQKPSDEMKVSVFDKSDFISFSKDNTFASTSATSLYRPIKVKRIIPNSNRKEEGSWIKSFYQIFL